MSPPFLGVPQIWRSRSCYKSIAVSFCDQLVCSRLLATQTRTSARDPVVSARGVRSELAEGGSSAPLWYVGGSSAAVPRRLRPVSPAEFALFQWPTTDFLEPGLENLLFGDAKIDVAEFGNLYRVVLAVSRVVLAVWSGRISFRAPIGPSACR